MPRWVGIDEAGYGPNLGPMVMTAVIAEGPGVHAPDLWGDLASVVARAGDPSGRLWVDDSKAVHRAGQGRDRLDEATLAVLSASGHEAPATFGALLEALGAGTLADAELCPWLDPDFDPPWPRTEAGESRDSTVLLHACKGLTWRIVEVRTVVVGPARFNAGLARSGSKAKVHFAAFARLLTALWESAGEDATHVCSDKHGGRHFYYEPLLDIFPDAWIDRGPEGPALSRYTVREVGSGRRLELRFMPRADAEDGLVALASIVSKAVRESWMDAFNTHWSARIPKIRPTAGYPVDAARFRLAIEADCLARGLDPGLWWRMK